MYKTASEVLAALDQEPNPAIVKSNYDGKSYISWNDAVAELDRIFGPFAWSTEAISQSGHPAQGVYLAALNLSATVLDDETGAPMTITRAGFGRGVAQPSKDEKSRGLNVSADLITHDTAASAAGSDALSKATKLVGKALGQKFYGQNRGNANAATSSRPAVVGTVTGDKSFSDKQVNFLHSLGYGDDDIAAMPYAAGKAVMDSRQRKAQATEPVGALPF